MSEPVLDVQGLTISYETPGGRIRALDDVGFRIGAGEALAIVGESGSGKSTVALAVLGLLAAEARVHGGTIRFQGRDLDALAPNDRRALRGNRISVVFQDPFTSLNPSLPIGLQVAEPLLHHKGMGRDDAHQRVLAALAEVGLPRADELARAYPHQLSGGMQQRVLIATALICEPALVILDEPTTALDVTIEAQILDLLEELRRRRRLSILFISHNLGVVSRLSDAICVLYAGKVLETGPTREVLLKPSHPYTKGLLASLPRLSAGGRVPRLSPIPGRFPNLAALPTGCVFHPRCPYVEDRCKTETQTLAEAGHNLRARCWKAESLAGAPWPEAIHAQSTVGAAGERAKTLVRIEDLRKEFRLGGMFAGVEMGWTKGRGPYVRARPMRVKAVDGVTLQIAPGEVLGLVGESGSGKSTLGRCLIRLLEPNGGRIVFADQDVTTAPERKLRTLRKEAQIIFQNPDSSLNPRKTVGDIVGRPITLFNAAPKAERPRRVAELLGKVGLSVAYAGRYPHQLSGGEKQRVGIARALATEPRFIVCDEAVSSLDVSVQATILNLLSDLRDNLGLAYLFISHDLSVVAHIATRIAVMYAGAVCEEGPTQNLLKPPYHPYTEALLSAIPLPDPRAAARQRIRLRGDAPGSGSSARGCRFAHRCPRKLGPICDEQAPPAVDAAPGHRIACHIPLDELRKIPPVLG